MKLGRGSRLDADGGRTTALIAVLATEHPASLTLDRLAHEYALKDELDAEWGHCHVNVGRTSARRGAMRGSRCVADACLLLPDVEGLGPE